MHRACMELAQSLHGACTELARSSGLTQAALSIYHPLVSSRQSVAPACSCTYRQRVPWAQQRRVFPGPDRAPPPLSVQAKPGHVYPWIPRPRSHGQLGGSRRLITAPGTAGWLRGPPASGTSCPWVRSKSSLAAGSGGRGLGKAHDRAPDSWYLFRNWMMSVFYAILGCLLLHRHQGFRFTVKTLIGCIR